MATDEEYLDNLLKSLQESSEDTESASENQKQTGAPSEKTVIKDMSEFDEKSMDDKEFSSGQDEDEDAEWKASLDELLSSADIEGEQQEAEEPEQNTINENINTGQPAEQNLENNIDVTQYIDNMEAADEDLSEINELLKKSDNNEAVEDDMMALLQSLGETEESSSDNKNEPSGTLNDNSGEGESADQKDKPVKKSFFNRKKGAAKESKRKKKKQEIRQEGTQEVGNKSEDESAGEQDALLTADGIPSDDTVSFAGDSGEEVPEWDDMIPERSTQDGGETPEKKKSRKRNKKEKEPKSGWFSRFIEFMSREEEEVSPSEEKLDENGQILKELEDEDKQKAKKKKEKKKKGKKDKEKGKESAEEKEGGLEEEGEEAPAEKKPKKEKKKKEDKPKEKPVKVLTKKTLLVMVAFCATLIAAIVSLSFFLPDFADKKNAREAFYSGDYQEVYRLLYDKNLNESDQLIFNRAGIVLKLERKLSSFQNNKKLGDEPKALNALLQGVAVFEEIKQQEQYGAEDELQQIYASIIGALEQDYSISEEEAKEINAYDEITYSQKIYSVVFGSEFNDPNEEKAEEPAIPLDILPEEEDIIDMENTVTGDL